MRFLASLWFFNPYLQHNYSSSPCGLILNISIWFEPRKKSSRSWIPCEKYDVQSQSTEQFAILIFFFFPCSVYQFMFYLGKVLLKKKIITTYFCLVNVCIRVHKMGPINWASMEICQLDIDSFNPISILTTPCKMSSIFLYYHTYQDHPFSFVYLPLGFILWQQLIPLVAFLLGMRLII